MKLYNNFSVWIAALIGLWFLGLVPFSPLFLILLNLVWVTFFIARVASRGLGDVYKRQTFQSRSHSLRSTTSFCCSKGRTCTTNTAKSTATNLGPSKNLYGRLDVR